MLSRPFELVDDLCPALKLILQLFDLLVEPFFLVIIATYLRLCSWGGPNSGSDELCSSLSFSPLLSVLFFLVNKVGVIHVAFFNLTAHFHEPCDGLMQLLIRVHLLQLILQFFTHLKASHVEVSVVLYVVVAVAHFLALGSKLFLLLSELLDQVSVIGLLLVEIIN